MPYEPGVETGGIVPACANICSISKMRALLGGSTVAGDARSATPFEHAGSAKGTGSGGEAGPRTMALAVQRAASKTGSPCAMQTCVACSSS